MNGPVPPTQRHPLLDVTARGPGTDSGRLVGFVFGLTGLEDGRPGDVLEL